MAFPLPPLSSASSSPFNFASSQSVLRDWLEAVTAFQLRYQQLQQYSSPGLHENPSSFHRSQCSPNQIHALRQRMHHELDALLVDFTGQPSLASLATHTRRLNAVTNQAVVTLTLLHQSSS